MLTSSGGRPELGLTAPSKEFSDLISQELTEMAVVLKLGRSSDPVGDRCDRFEAEEREREE